MSKSTEILLPNPQRFNLNEVYSSLEGVHQNWTDIDDQLYKTKIGRRDTAFDEIRLERMMIAFEYIDYLLAANEEPFSLESIHHLLELNNRVHYGLSPQVREEYSSSMELTATQFYQQIDFIANWYNSHKDKKKKEKILRLPPEIYVSVLSFPQLYVNGNHRSGSLIANWISMYYGQAPFVLSVENALAYFEPSAHIKKFAEKLSIRGKLGLPKYHKSFGKFWQQYIDEKYILKTPENSEESNQNFDN